MQGVISNLNVFELQQVLVGFFLIRDYFDDTMETSDCFENKYRENGGKYLVLLVN